MNSLSVRLVLGACAVVAVLAGCSDSTAGNARPAEPLATDGGSSEPESPTPTTKPTGSQAASPLDGIDPCELLSTSDRALLGVSEGTPKKIGKSDTCAWPRSGEFGVIVGLKSDLAFKDADLRGATPNRVDIGRHEAYRVENAGGGTGGVCEVFIVTGESSFAQVTATMSTNDTAKACERATALSKIVDPKLP